MYASSREAFGRAQEVLTAELAAAPAAAETVGRALLDVVGLLGENRALRTALTDRSAEPAERRGLAQRLFGGKIDDAAVTVLTTTVEQDWSRPEDLVDGLERLGRSALLRSAANAGELETVEDELFRLGRVLAANPVLEQAAGTRSRSAEDRAGLIAGLLAGKAHPVTIALATQAVRGDGRRAAAADAIDGLADLAAAQRDQAVAHVQTPTDLSDAQRDDLVRRLSELYDRPVTLHVEVDRAVVGGLAIRVGGEVIDGSIAGQFATLKRAAH